MLVRHVERPQSSPRPHAVAHGHAALAFHVGGSAELEQRGRLRVGASDVHIIPPGEAHRLTRARAVDVWCLGFDVVGLGAARAEVSPPPADLSIVRGKTAQIRYAGERMKLPTLLVLTCAALPACTEEGPDKPSTTTTTTTTSTTTTSTSGDDSGDDGGVWAVGERGAMLRLGSDGAVSQYPPELAEDLRAIACKGAEQAVVAGAAGVVLTTFDAGASWDRVELGDAVELRAVALSAGPLGYIVGDGVVLRSQDDSRTWSTLALASHDWTAITTTAAGTTALLTTAAGQIFRLHDTELALVHPGDGSLLAGIAVTPDGAEAVAVGQTGLVLRSSDGGERWAAEAPVTTRDLHAVRIAGDASLVVAVGQSGVVVRMGLDDIATQELLDPALSLRALHLSQHHGHAVGDDGVMFTTHDLGRTWDPVAVGLDHDLLGLDDLHGEPHL